MACKPVKTKTRSFASDERVDAVVNFLTEDEDVPEPEERTEFDNSFAGT
jgi:hypothetical protein